MSIPKEGARHKGAWKVIFTTPDVCFVQVGQAVMPTPFPCVTTLDKEMKYAKKVRFTKEKAVMFSSKFKSCQGDAAGNKKGIKSGTKGKKCWPTTNASKVNIQKSPAIRHLETCKMNDGNTFGKLYCFGDMSPYPLELAQANTSTGVMTDAPPLKLPKVTTRGAGRAVGAASLADMVLQELARDSSHDIKAFTAIVNGKAEIVDHNLLWGRKKGFNPFSASDWEATGWPSEAKYGVIISPEERIPLANDILSAKAGEPVDIRAMTQEEVGAIIQADAEKDTTNEKTETQVRVEDKAVDPDDPCKHLKDGKNGGGAHKKMKGPTKDGKDSHHLPADSTSPLEKDQGPAIRMDPSDHKMTKSWGSSRSAIIYRKKIAKLVKSGQWRQAMDLEIEDVKRVAKQIGDPKKYDKAIEEMEKYFECLEENGLLPPQE